MLCVTTLVLGPSNFDRRRAGKSSLFLFFSFPFLSLFLSYEPFSFCFFLSFLSFFCFSPFLFFSLYEFFSFCFSIFSSHFLFSFGIFSYFQSIIDRLVKGGSFLPLSSCHLCGPQFSFIFFNSFIFFYCIINHVANCEPHIQVHHMALAMCHSLGVPWGIPLAMPYVIRHPTP